MDLKNITNRVRSIKTKEKSKLQCKSVIYEYTHTQNKLKRDLSLQVSLGPVHSSLVFVEYITEGKKLLPLQMRKRLILNFSKLTLLEYVFNFYIQPISFSCL